MWITTLFTIVLVLGTVLFSYQDNNRAQKEFELQMRPYIIIGLIKPSYNIESKTSNYTIELRNIGNIPANIESITYLYKNGNNSVKEDPHIYKNGIVIGKDQSTEVKISSTSICALNVTVVVNYQSAIEDFKTKLYKTDGTFEHNFGKTELKILGNHMS
jgi:hypothetical protein